MLLSGISPGKFLSPRDVTLRGMLSKRKATESHRLRALMAASLGDADVANETYSKYIDSQWYTAVKESRNERMFKEYYTQYKHMTPEIGLGQDGKPMVRGLT